MDYKVDIDYEFLKNISCKISNPHIKRWAINYLDGHLSHYEHIIKKVLGIAQNITCIRILEIGAVPGHITTVLKKNNCVIEVVDIDPERTKEIFEYSEIKTYKVDIEKDVLPIGNDQYDLVLLNEVLEHLRTDPLKIFYEIYRVLKKEALFFISTPNITPLMRINFLFGKDYMDNIIGEFAKIEIIGHMGHYRIYSKNEVIKILKYFNFELVDISYGGNIHKSNNKFIDKIFLFFFKEKMKKQVHIIAKKITNEKI